MKTKFLLLFLSYLFALSNPAKAYEDSIERRINLWPLFVYSEDKTKKLTRIELLGPFISQSSNPEKKSFSLRPIYSSVEKKNNQTFEKRAYFLSPLGYYQENQEEIKLKLIPLVERSIKKDPSEGEGQKWEFFPFFKGKTAHNATYGGLFPIYGMLKDRFGAKEISFFLWPVYSKVEYETHTSFHVLWPFFRVLKPKIENDTSYVGWKFWPLYGHFKEGEEERRFVLWPFYLCTHYRDEMGNFLEKRYFFPFYLRESSETYEKRIYLWPFFQKVCGYDPPYCQLDAPWPFYRKISGENIESQRFWPLYGWVKRPEMKEFFLLWPFYFQRNEWANSSKGNFSEREIRFLLFSKHLEVKSNESLFSLEFRLWPIYYYYEQPSPQRLSSFYFPALLPFYDEGIERNYAPFLKLYEIYNQGNYTFSKALFGLYRRERFNKREVIEIAFLLRQVKDEQTYYVEFLEGLLGLGVIEGNRTFKIFYFPIVLSSPSSNPEEGGRQN